MAGMRGGISPRQMQQAMKKMGINGAKLKFCILTSGLNCVSLKLTSRKKVRYSNTLFSGTVLSSKFTIPLNRQFLISR